mmetsp:Transcript_308/g.1018  ORF Transcript_308/g.1018 Transcript_308/m.1018 type:complete len:256 (-) Transcript_308:2058-2825(-)
MRAMSAAPVGTAWAAPAASRAPPQDEASSTHSSTSSFPPRRTALRRTSAKVCKPTRHLSTAACSGWARTAYLSITLNTEPDPVLKTTPSSPEPTTSAGEVTAAASSVCLARLIRASRILSQVTSDGGGGARHCCTRASRPTRYLVGTGKGLRPSTPASTSLSASLSSTRDLRAAAAASAAGERGPAAALSLHHHAEGSSIVASAVDIAPRARQRLRKVASLRQLWTLEKVSSKHRALGPPGARESPPSSVPARAV